MRAKAAAKVGAAAARGVAIVVDVMVEVAEEGGVDEEEVVEEGFVDEEEAAPPAPALFVARADRSPGPARFFTLMVGRTACGVSLVMPLELPLTRISLLL